MIVRLLDRGILFDVTALGDTPELNTTLKGSLYDTERDIFLFIEGVELYEYFKAQPSGRILVQLSFYHKSKEYFFKGKFIRTLTKYDTNLVEIEATSGISEKIRKSSLRLELSLPVNMYVQTNDDTRDHVCSGTTVEISTETICFLSRGKLGVPKDSRFVVEFTLCKTEQFNLPVKLVRYGNSPQSVQYRHDYALVYDFSGIEEEKNRLLTTLFKHNLEARK